jgi:hypothetical protein
MRKKGSRNKRQTCSMKYKIKARSAEHKRKVKKESRKAAANGVLVRQQRSKATHLPNTDPDKVNIIKKRYFTEPTETSNIKKPNTNNRTKTLEIPTLMN